jgi:hypothetical protein
MKSVVVGIVAIAVLGTAAVSTAGPSAEPQASNASITSLERKLRRTDARVKKLDARVKKLETRSKLLTTVAAAMLAGLACEAANTADSLQRTWSVIDEMAQATQAKTYFGPQTPLVDHQSCSDLDIARGQPAPAPPSLRSFQEVINFFYGP